MKNVVGAIVLVVLGWSAHLPDVDGFVVSPSPHQRRTVSVALSSRSSDQPGQDDGLEQHRKGMTLPIQDDSTVSPGTSRRSAIANGAAVAAGLVAAGTTRPSAAGAAVGTLPEYQDTSVILQGLTVNVADKSQLDAMVNFFIYGFDGRIVRQRVDGGITDVVRTMRSVHLFLDSSIDLFVWHVQRQVNGNVFTLALTIVLTLSGSCFYSLHQSCSTVPIAMNTTR